MNRIGMAIFGILTGIQACNAATLPTHTPDVIRGIMWGSTTLIATLAVYNAIRAARVD